MSRNGKGYSDFVPFSRKNKGSAKNKWINDAIYNKESFNLFSNILYYFIYPILYTKFYSLFLVIIAIELSTMAK